MPVPVLCYACGCVRSGHVEVHVLPDVLLLRCWVLVDDVQAFAFVALLRVSVPVHVMCWCLLSLHSHPALTHSHVLSSGLCSE